MSKAKERAFFDDEFDVSLQEGDQDQTGAGAGKKKGRKKKAPDPRINMAFYDKNLKFCQYASWKNRQSITQYVNALIAKEMANYDQAEWDVPDEEE